MDQFNGGRASCCGDRAVERPAKNQKAKSGSSSETSRFTSEGDDRRRAGSLFTTCACRVTLRASISQDAAEVAHHRSRKEVVVESKLESPAMDSGASARAQLLCPMRQAPG